MKVFLAHCDFAPSSLALLNLKSYALADPTLSDVEIRLQSGGFPHTDPEESIQRIVDAAKEHQPDVIGLSLYIWSRRRIYEATRRLRELFPKAFIIWGGPDVSDPEYALTILEEHPYVDVCVRDEGEQTFRRLLHHRKGDGESLPEIRGISWRGPEGPVSNPQVEFLDNLDDIPSAMDMPEVQEALRTMEVFAIETFRGCYMGCAYCYWGGTRRRSYSMERAYSDLGKILAHKNIKKVWFFDSMFGFKKSVAKEMLRFIIDNKAPDQHLTFFPNLDFIDEELCVLMKEAGIYIETGIQTTNERAYEYLNRKWDKEFLDRKLPMLAKHGLRINDQQLILGLPGDDLEGFRSSVDYAFNTRPEVILVFPFSLLPATGYWRKRDEFALKYEGEYRIVYHSTTFPEADMIVGGVIMVGTKWFERFPGLATQTVGILGIRASEFFEQMGWTFLENVLGRDPKSMTNEELRRLLLVQALADEHTQILDLDLYKATLLRFHRDKGLEFELLELLRLQHVLNCDTVLDLRRDDAEDSLEAWRNHPGALPEETAQFNVFDASTWSDVEQRRQPIRFVAYPSDGPRDFFGKDVPRYHVIVLGEVGKTPALAPLS